MVQNPVRAPRTIYMHSVLGALAQNVYSRKLSIAFYIDIYV